MNALRIATQGLRGGVVPLAIASQGFQPLRQAVISSGGAPRGRRRDRLIDDDEAILLAFAQAFACGRLSG